MAKQIILFRYYGEDNNNNFPGSLSKENLVSGKAFKSYKSIILLGILTLPGVEFYLNGNNVYSILVGNTGIYELNLNNLSQITSLAFSSNSIDLIGGLENGALIIDMMYEDGSE